MKKVTTAALAVAGLIGSIAIVPSAQAAPTEITVWAMCSEIGEVKAVKEQTDAFNEANSGSINATLVCKADMGKTLGATPAAELADVFEFDGETLAFQVYNRKLARLDGVVSAARLKDQLKSIKAQNTYSDKHVYAISQYEAGFSLLGNKAMLSAAGVTSVPKTWDKAWTAAQFTDVLKKLAAKAEGGKALDIKENYGIGGGWGGFAFTPIVASAGTQIVGANGKAVGALNSPAVAKAATTWASWKQYVDPNADDKAFTNKRVALSWCGHWCTPAYKTALGNDLIAIPFPDFGQGTKSGQGSHAWAMGAKTTGAKKAAAAKYLEFITTDKWILNTTSQNGAVPASSSALAKSPDHIAGGYLELYGKQLSVSCGGSKPTKACVTVPRTVSAAWPVINTQTSKAFAAIYGGANAQAELTKAAKAIDLDAKDNNNYK